MTTRAVRPLWVLAALGVAATAAAATVAGLQMTAKPSDFAARLAAVQEQARASAATLKQPAGVAPPAGAFCTLAPAAQATKLVADIKASGADLVFERLDVAAIPQAETPDGLTPIVLQVSATGAYDADLALLQRLSSLRPILLIDTADLVAKTSVVTLKLSGRVLCSAHH